MEQRMLELMPDEAKAVLLLARQLPYEITRALDRIEAGGPDAGYRGLVWPTPGIDLLPWAVSSLGAACQCQPREHREALTSRQRC
jgi:hypothetical protein